MGKELSAEQRDRRTCGKIATLMLRVGRKWGARPPHEIKWRLSEAVAAISFGDRAMLLNSLAELESAPSPEGWVEGERF